MQKGARLPLRLDVLRGAYSGADPQMQDLLVPVDWVNPPAAPCGVLLQKQRAEAHGVEASDGSGSVT